MLEWFCDLEIQKGEGLICWRVQWGKASGDGGEWGGTNPNKKRGPCCGEVTPINRTMEECDNYAELQSIGRSQNNSGYRRSPLPSEPDVVAKDHNGCRRSEHMSYGHKQRITFPNRNISFTIRSIYQQKHIIPEQKHNISRKFQAETYHIQTETAHYRLDPYHFRTETYNPRRAT